MKLADAAAFTVLGLLESADYPPIALNALENGCDSPSLRVLASEFDPIWSEIEPLFLSCLSELSIELPGREQALHRVAKFYAMRIVSGEMTPYEGARSIWQSTMIDNKTPEQLLVFVGLASEIEDLPNRIGEADSEQFLVSYRQQILDEAKKLLSGD